MTNERGLVLQRRECEALLIGAKRLVVHQVRPDVVRVTYDGQPVTLLVDAQAIELERLVLIRALGNRGQGRRALIYIAAPREVKILRAELVDREGGAA